MHNNTLIIGKPFVITDGTHSALKAQIIDAGETKDIEYRVDSRWGHALTPERSDAFVVALLYYAMVNERDIEWETPCNERLIYQLETYFIPVYAKEIPSMHPINLKGPTTTELLPCEGGVATGISNGVDSSYTIHKYLSPRYQTNKLTHLVFTDWYTTDNSDENRALFVEQNLAILPQAAKSLNLEFIFAEFHPDMQCSVGHIQDPVCGEIQDVGLFTLKYCSIAMALQKLLSIYYFSSGFSVTEFTFQEPDTGYQDLFTLPLLTTQAQSFYSTGMEVNRIEKVREIADWDYAQKHLQVCLRDNDVNCGACSKCIRTMSELYALGKLQLFNDRFPVGDYLKHLPQRFAMVLVEARRGHVFEEDILATMRKEGKKVPVGAYLLFPCYAVKECIRVNLRTRRWARKIYRRFHLDKVLYGRSTEGYAQSMDSDIVGNRSGNAT